MAQPVSVVVDTAQDDGSFWVVPSNAFRNRTFRSRGKGTPRRQHYRGAGRPIGKRVESTAQNLAARRRINWLPHNAGRLECAASRQTSLRDLDALLLGESSYFEPGTTGLFEK